jgi:hypothetical protein
MAPIHHHKRLPGPSHARWPLDQAMKMNEIQENKQLMMLMIAKVKHSTIFHTDPPFPR